MTEKSSEASTEQVKGSVKEAIGKLTGNPRVEAEGRREKRETALRKSTATRKV